MMTDVVPSPHFLSRVLLSSIMFFAARCATSISRGIALPSFVNLLKIQIQQWPRSHIQAPHRIPLIGSRIIFTIAFGPKHVLITSVIVYRRVGEGRETLWPP